MTSMKYKNLCESVGTNGVKSWTEFELLGDGCGWGVEAVFFFFFFFIKFNAEHRCVPTSN